jgi:hypothetical protein
MGVGTYGLGTSVRGPGGSGPGLASVGSNQQQQAVGMLGRVAEQEVQRDMANAASKQAHRQGAIGLAVSGATTGAMIGGWPGALIGGAAGLAVGLLG